MDAAVRGRSSRPSPSGVPTARNAMASSRAPSPPTSRSRTWLAAHHIGEGHAAHRESPAPAPDCPRQTVPPARSRRPVRGSRAGRRRHRVDHPARRLPHSAASAPPNCACRNCAESGRAAWPSAKSPPPWRGRRPIRSSLRFGAPRARCAPISRPAMERAEPRPMPPSKPATKAGLAKRSFSRPATIPTTPGCQPSPRHQQERRIVLRGGQSQWLLPG